MKPTLAAILARFDGDRAAAADYCCDIVWSYPDLRDEYSQYAFILLNS